MRLLESEPAREAVDTLRGYDWQRWLTVERWLELTGEESLWIEWGEDITIVGHGEARTIQAKDVKKRVTLGQAKILELIGTALTRDPNVQTIIWTSAEPGYERGKPFSEPGIVHWDKVVSGATPADKLGDYLINSTRLPKEARTLVSQTSKSDIPALLGRIVWITEEKPIDGIKSRILPIAEARITSLGIPNASILRENAADWLFSVVADVSIKSSAKNRRLTRPDLDKVFLRQFSTILWAISPALYYQAESQQRGQNSAIDLLGDATLKDLRKQISAVPEKTAQIILESIGSAETPSLQPNSHSPHIALKTPEPIPSDSADALERDMEQRFRRALQRSLFPEAAEVDEFRLLAVEALEDRFASVKESLRRRILLHAARSSAVRSAVQEAQSFFSAATSLDGNDTELPAAAQIAESLGDTDKAIELLRDQTDAESRSTLLSILTNVYGYERARSWFHEANLRASDLTANGVCVVTQIYIQTENIEKLVTFLDKLTIDQCVTSPYLFLWRGMISLASALATPGREVALMGIPLDARMFRPILPEPELSARLDAAIADLQRIQPIVTELDLRESARTAEAFTRWCELLHVGRKQSALLALRREISEPKTACRDAQFALAYDPDFDPNPLRNHLERREELVGLGDDELRALLVLNIHRNDSLHVAELIRKYRPRLVSLIGRSTLYSLEIQALIQARELTSAKLLLDSHHSLFRPDVFELLKAEIAQEEGSDPAAEYRRVYEQTKSPEALRALVGALVKRKDQVATAKFAEQLYELTSDPQDLDLAVRALARVGDDKNFLRLMTMYRFVSERNAPVAVHYARVLLRNGEIGDAADKLEEARKRFPETRDFELELALAIESGDWESIGGTLAFVLENQERQTGTALIRAAHLAYTLDQGPVVALLEAAVHTSPTDPNVLLGAYMLVQEAGLDEREAEAASWFGRAAELSGPEGPIWQFEIKELLSQQTEWMARVRKTNEEIARGDTPLLVAAISLRTTLVDVYLRNFARNYVTPDPRGRVAVPLFNGQSLVRKLSSSDSVALDLSAVLTLGWLGVLAKVLAGYSKVTVPAGLFSELYEGRRRIRQFQASRLRRAAELREEIRSSNLQVVSSLGVQEDLDRTVGVELATLIRTAKSDGGIVVCPAPVYEQELDRGEADLSSYSGILADLHSLVTVLSECGVVDQVTERDARRHFEAQDKGWPEPAMPKIEAPLFLDSIAVTFLQSVNLFELVLRTFRLVYVHKSAQDEALSLFEHEAHANKALETIDRIREVIRGAYRSGNLRFGPRASWDSENDERREWTTANLIADHWDASVVVFDDRALNKREFVVDGKGHRARIVSSIDVIDDLASRGLVDDEERMHLRHRLRRSGAVLVPIDIDEIVAGARRSIHSEAAEIRAIRESIGLARISKLPRFPLEIPWFASIESATRVAICRIWVQEPSKVLASEMANLLLDLFPNPEDWLSFWEGEPPQNWVEAVSRTRLVGLALPFEIDDSDVVERYGQWLEEVVWEPMRRERPQQYRAFLDLVEEFIVQAAEDVGDEDDG